MWHCSVLLLCLGLLRICADRPAPLLSPSCGRILNSLCFLCSYNSPGWLLEAAFCFPEDGTKAPVCSFSLADSGLCFWEHSSYQTSSPQPLAASLRLCSGSGGVPGGVLGLALGRGVLGGGACGLILGGGSLLPEACGSPEAVSRGCVPLMPFEILICFLFSLLPLLRLGGHASVLWGLPERNKTSLAIMGTAGIPWFFMFLVVLCCCLYIWCNRHLLKSLLVTFGRGILLDSVVTTWGFLFVSTHLLHTFCSLLWQNS